MPFKPSDVLSEKFLHHPDVADFLDLHSWVTSENPFYVWRTIGRSLRESRAVPDWANEYLLICADRMETPDFHGKKGVRAALPRIFGFKGKIGGENPLDPDPDGFLRINFLLHFAIALEQGHSPAKSRSDAAARVMPVGRDIVEDKTLRKWLRQELAVKALPKNADHLRKLCRAKLAEVFYEARTLYRHFGS